MPTLVGWLVILLVLALGTLFLLRNIALFLTVDAPVGADYLLIEGWMDKDELDQSLAYFEAGDYLLAIIVGGPITNDFHGIDTNFAERAAQYLRGKGLAPDRLAIVTVPASAQSRTFLNAVMVREWFAQQGIGISKLDVFSTGVHTRRSRDLYQIAFGDDVAIGVIASRPQDFDAARWWQSTGTGKGVAVEFAGWLLFKCCFDPGQPGSHLEKWGIEKTPTNAQ